MSASKLSLFLCGICKLQPVFLLLKKLSFKITLSLLLHAPNEGHQMENFIKCAVLLLKLMKF